MSHKTFSAVARGAHKFVEEAEAACQKAVEKHGESAKIGFPQTAFHLPMIYALTGRKVETLGDIKPILEHCRQDLLHPVPDEEV